MSDALTIRYNNSFKNVVDGINKKKKDKKVKILQAPMGFGKTHNLITVWIPYLYEKTDVQVIVITAPMSDIVADNVKKLKNFRSTILPLHLDTFLATRAPRKDYKIL